MNGFTRSLLAAARAHYGGLVRHGVPVQGGVSVQSFAGNGSNAFSLPGVERVGDGGVRVAFTWVEGRDALLSTVHAFQECVDLVGCARRSRAFVRVRSRAGGGGLQYGKLDQKTVRAAFFTLSLGGVVDVQADDHSVVFRRVDRGDQPLHFGKLRRPGRRAVEHRRGPVARLQAGLRSSEGETLS